MTNQTVLLANKTCFFLEVILFQVTDRPLYITTIVTSVINTVFAVFAIMGNSVIVFVLIRTSALRTCSNLFLGNLVLSDLLVGAMVQPLFVIYKIGETLGNHSCQAHALFATSAWLCSGMSFLTLTALNCERGIAIFAPLRYKTLVSPRRVLGISLCMWLSALLLVSSRFYGLTNAAFYVISCTIIVVSLMTFLIISIQIYRVVQRHRTQIASTLPLDILQREAHEAGHARNVAWVTFIFFMCYLPTLAVMIAYTIVDYSASLKTVYLCSDTLVFLNSSLNPGIYCWRNKSIRKAVLKYLKLNGTAYSNGMQTHRRLSRPAVITDNIQMDSLGKHNTAGYHG